MKSVFGWSKKALVKEITRDMETYFEINAKEHPSYKNLWVQIKLYLKGSL